MICALPFMMLVPLLPGVSPTAEEIMCRVAENQQRSQAERNSYVYDMNVFVRMKRAGGSLAREEERDYVVAPTSTGAKRKLVRVEGKVQAGRKAIPYTDPKFRYKGLDVDGELTESFANDLLWKDDTQPRPNWFPLTAGRQKNATFRLAGEERYQDYEVYKVTWEEHGDDGECWSGEALIEKQEFQPVLVTTAWECRIPGAVKVLLGTNVTQLGAKITYRRLAKDVWFPVNCGGEVKFRVLFLYARTVAFSARNSGFRKADVKSSIDFESAGN